MSPESGATRVPGGRAVPPVGGEAAQRPADLSAGAGIVLPAPGCGLLRAPRRAPEAARGFSTGVARVWPGLREPAGRGGAHEHPSGCRRRAHGPAAGLRVVWGTGPAASGASGKGAACRVPVSSRVRRRWENDPHSVLREQREEWGTTASG